MKKGIGHNPVYVANNERIERRAAAAACRERMNA